MYTNDTIHVSIVNGPLMVHVIAHAQEREIMMFQENKWLDPFSLKYTFVT